MTMPCEGCKKRDEIDMGIKGNFKMKFVGRPDGKLMKGAPGNFIHGQEYVVPYGHSKFDFWVLIEEIPELKVPAETESFEEAYYIPDNEAASDEAVIALTSSVPTERSDDYVPPLNAPASISPHMTLNQATGELTPYVEPEKEAEPSEADLLKQEIEKLKAELAATQNPPEETEAVTEPSVSDRKVLLAVLTESGVEVKKGTRTTTLQKMVDELEEN